MTLHHDEGDGSRQMVKNRSVNHRSQEHPDDAGRVTSEKMHLPCQDSSFSAD